jgi:hypothetical protein
MEMKMKMKFWGAAASSPYPKVTPRRKWRESMKKQKNDSERYFGKNRKILKRANFERSPWDL